MARGWESKSIESQIEAAEARRAPKKPKVSAEELAKRSQQNSLLLSRTRILREIEAARHPRHRATLEASLKFLDEKLKELG
jgi:hypothetical protein